MQQAQYFSGIGFGTRNPPAPKLRPYHEATAAITLLSQAITGKTETLRKKRFPPFRFRSHLTPTGALLQTHINLGITSSVRKSRLLPRFCSIRYITAHVFLMRKEHHPFSVNLFLLPNEFVDIVADQSRGYSLKLI
ncbi:hypothetical protein AVEN_172779-1 [Araneus ventricosus]|uniref:Uncharacterized protein n=1 Tax=Araneus ventricosus TaxID=182803 RepID=A0A4Y2BHY9_ARAVE|nr:hypothetical protein AVEN_172779-1 [Araneus ventricosus]